MKKITFKSFSEEGLLAKDCTLDYKAQMEIFSHSFFWIPRMIKSGDLYTLNPVTLDLLASYIEGKVKTSGQFKRPEDDKKTYNIWKIGKIYEELANNFPDERRRLLFRAICESSDCKQLRDSRGKPLTERNIREYIDQYELERSEKNRLC